MPASMMSAETGWSAKVAGSSIAMVATGPMPGSTPISVPRKQPIRQYMMFDHVRATPKPSMRLFTSSMEDPLGAADRERLQGIDVGTQGNRQLQAHHEDERAEDNEEERD